MESDGRFMVGAMTTHPIFPATSENHRPTPRAAFQKPTRVEDFPGLVACWEFNERLPDGSWPTCAGEAYPLREQAGTMSLVEDPSLPQGLRALSIEQGQWLAIPRRDCPRLNFHGQRSALTLLAWLKRTHPQPGCEFIAGQWNETQLSRQYGLFINIKTWQQENRLCGHLSRTGGPTPGYQYCMDGPLGNTPIDSGQWHCAAMSYDGQSGYVWLDGLLDAQPLLNPYLLPGGLHDGGEQGSDFTVGAVNRSGQVGNFFSGLLARLAVFDRVLSPAEMWAIARPIQNK